MFFFSSRRRHTRFDCDWSSDVCSSDLPWLPGLVLLVGSLGLLGAQRQVDMSLVRPLGEALPDTLLGLRGTDRVIPQIGRASCRQRGYVWVREGALKTKEG